jgi:hypothetical protein
MILQMPTRWTGQRRLAGQMTAVVIVLQVAVIGTFLLDPGSPPQRGRLWQALWALKHRESFIPLIALLVVGPPATWLAWTVRGRHRRWIIAAWIIFGLVAASWFAHRLVVMSRLVWDYGL